LRVRKKLLSSLFKKKIKRKREDKRNHLEKIIAKFPKFLKKMVKDALQTLMKEERLIYLEDRKNSLPCILRAK